MTLDRRSFFRALGATGLSLAVPKLAAAERPPAERCYRAFRAAVKKQPALDPWRSVNQSSFAPLSLVVEGDLPKALRGTLYRNGPAGFERNGARYQHWFDGDGMVQAFRITDRGITHHGQKVRTTKWQKEQKAGRFLLPGAGSTVPNSEPSLGNDGGNPANISVIAWGDDLLALWEAGSPWALDPETLETRERVVWSPETDGMSFSAHPLLETDGRMWNFGLAQWVGKSGKLAVYGLSPARGLERVTLIDLPFAGYMHSFAMSERWLIFYLAPHVFRPGRANRYVAAHAWDPERGGKILLVDKSDFQRQRWLDAPPGFIWHFADAAERPNGEIKVRASWADGPETMDEGMYRVMCGDADSLPDNTRLVTLTVPATGRTARLEENGLPGEFPIVDTRGESPFLAMAHGRELRMLDARGRERRVRAPGRIELEEHRFVPSGAKLGDGWLVGTGYDLDARASVLTVFDTRSESNAPVAVARMDRRIPFGFHGWFWPAR